MDVIPAELSNRFNQAINKYIQAAKRSADAGDMLFRDPEEDQLRIQEERAYFNMENVFQEICDLANGDYNIIELFNIRFNDAERIVDDYRAGARADQGVSVQLSNRFNQARDAYIEAAMRRIDFENNGINFDDKEEVKEEVRLNEIEDRELENFSSIYADIRNHNVNVGPFMLIFEDAKGTIIDYEDASRERAIEREERAERGDVPQLLNFRFSHKKSPKRSPKKSAPKRSPKRLSVGTKSQVWKGLAKKTFNGLTKKDLMKNKNGNVVIRK